MTQASLSKFEISRLNERDRSVQSACYADVAHEYYDHVLHPTCRNFREASVLLFREYLTSISSPRSVLEVGCGRSIVPEVFCDGHWTSLSISLVDESPVMLQHSDEDLLKISRVFYSDVSRFQIDQGFDLAISSLGDPYNSVESWAQVASHVNQNGYLFYSTPTLEWAMRFRIGEEGTKVHVSRFLDRDGRIHDLPSIVIGLEQQLSLFASVGFHLKETSDFYVEDLSSPVSQKLVAAGQNHVPIVRGYLLQKR